MQTTQASPTMTNLKPWFGTDEKALLEFYFRNCGSRLTLGCDGPYKSSEIRLAENGSVRMSGNMLFVSATLNAVNFGYNRVRCLFKRGGRPSDMGGQHFFPVTFFVRANRDGTVEIFDFRLEWCEDPQQHQQLLDNFSK